MDNNFRPVSNLAYVSKLAECAATSQPIEHVNRFNPMEPNQLAYRALCSTETALLKVKTDIISALDCQEVACLILLDLSAAFNTIDYSILLQQLQQHFAVSSISLEWFCSYPTNIGNILSDGCKSAPMPLRSAIPQGLVPGPILFMLYTVLLGDICHRNGIEFHLYAGDTQVYLTLNQVSQWLRKSAWPRLRKV